MASRTVVVDYASYAETLLEFMWAWADRRHADELDGGTRIRRPPVLCPEFASNNLLVPDDRCMAHKIVSAIDLKQRHRWFRSFKSSQALTQSVFGALLAFRRMAVIRNVTAECGRPAFLEDAREPDLHFEYEVLTLAEPRRTNVDVYLESPFKRVAVECKFTERQFGFCSRPRLRPQDPAYAEQCCNGDYRRQRGRLERCALTEIGVRYWTYLPRLFDWNADQDLTPCPFSAVYQLARNALAATVTADGIDPCTGHVLVMYDARNPEFQVGGEAQRQYNAAIAASHVPGLIRRLSWQHLAGELAKEPKLAYLVAGLERKYGIRPE